jgi:hypothetical protein
METPAIVSLIYIGIGVAIFATPRLPLTPGDLHWRPQLSAFRRNFRDVMIWPLALYLLVAERR